MHRRAFTLIELILTIILLGVLVSFALPDLSSELRRRSLSESADRLRSAIMMARASAMQDGVKYRIMFPGTPDPKDPLAEKEIDVPMETQQPVIERQVNALEDPEAFGGFDGKWNTQPILQDGTRCVAVLPGRPNFEITPESPIAGPSIAEGLAEFVPLTLKPDGTCDWVTFVLTDLPPDIDVEAHHVGRILNVIVDGRTGETWVQRALRVEEVEVMIEHGASPILHMDFTRKEAITEENILEVHIGRGGRTSVGRRGAEGGGE